MYDQHVLVSATEPRQSPLSGGRGPSDRCAAAKRYCRRNLLTWMDPRRFLLRRCAIDPATNETGKTISLLETTGGRDVCACIRYVYAYIACVAYLCTCVNVKCVCECVCKCVCGCVHERPRRNQVTAVELSDPRLITTIMITTKYCLNNIMAADVD